MLTLHSHFPPLACKDADWREAGMPRWLASSWAQYSICFALAGLVMYLLSLAPGSRGIDVFSTAEPVPLLLAVFLTLPLHEVVHGLGYPGFGFTSRTHFGFSKEHAAGFCAHLDPMSRARTLLCLVLPFLVMTVLPVVLVFAGVLTNEGWKVLAVMNCLGSGGDIVLALAIAWRVPGGALVGYDHGKPFFKAA